MESPLGPEGAFPLRSVEIESIEAESAPKSAAGALSASATAKSATAIAIRPHSRLRIPGDRWSSSTDTGPTARAAEVNALRADGVRPVEIARRLGIGRASVYRVLAA